MKKNLVIGIGSALGGMLVCVVLALGAAWLMPLDRIPGFAPALSCKQQATAYVAAVSPDLKAYDVAAAASLKQYGPELAPTIHSMQTARLSVVAVPVPGCIASEGAAISASLAAMVQTIIDAQLRNDTPASLLFLPRFASASNDLQTALASIDSVIQ